MTSKTREQIKEELLTASAKVVSGLALKAYADGVLAAHAGVADSQPGSIQALKHTSNTFRTSLDWLLAMNDVRPEISAGQWQATIDISGGDSLPTFSMDDFERAIETDDLSDLPPREAIALSYIKRMRAELNRILAE